MRTARYLAMVGSKFWEVVTIAGQTLIWHRATELLLTCVLLCGVTTIVRFVVGPSPISRAIPEIHLELIIVGALVGLLLAWLIMSRPGSISGGHMNPAISLGMWRFGVFPGSGVGGLIGLGVAALGDQTGGSLNPARQFGPALVSGHTAELWAFLVAPMSGAELAPRLLHAIQKRHQVLTYRLCGTRPDGRPLDDWGREPGPVVNGAA